MNDQLRVIALAALLLTVVTWLTVLVAKALFWLFMQLGFSAFWATLSAWFSVYFLGFLGIDRYILAPARKAQRETAELLSKQGRFKRAKAVN